jgi:hypothetical protein
MEGADALGLIAEIGIAIAGFAGVIAALRAPGGRIGAYAAMRIGGLLGQSATLVLAALLPFVLHSAGLTSSTVWALSSSAMAIFILLIILVSLRIFRRVAPAEVEDRSPGVRLIGPTMIAFMLAIGLLQVANVMFIRQLWPMVTGLLGIMAVSLFMFGYILFAPASAEVPA